YPATFFQDEYIPMQLEDAKWASAVDKYGFDIIYWRHQEGTPWGRSFFRQRVTDNQWKMVQIDRYNAIFIPANDRPDLANIDVNNVEKNIAYLLNSHDYEDTMVAGDILEIFGLPDRAVSIYQKLIEKYPRDYRAYLSLGSLYGSTSDPTYLNKAVTLLNAAAELGYKKSSLYNQLGVVYFNLKLYEKARQAWYTSLLYSPTDVGARDYLKQLKDIIPSL
ncbi:MAG: hypothetical protein NUV82_01970, partial [Candidatus Komeilibacteria bacterium]|nr:hypothetical protein [Candidatus Komeilibacteria bacterium]